MPFRLSVDSDTNCLRQTSIRNSESFRLAVLFAGLFLLLAAALLSAVLWIVDDTQTAELSRANDADIALVANGFRDEGVNEATEVVKQRLGSSAFTAGSSPGAFIVIEDQAGKKLAGNLSAFAPRLGVFALPLSPAPRDAASGAAEACRDRSILGRGVDIAPGIYLFVGRDTAPLAATRARILQAFVGIAAAAIVFGVLGGALLRSQFMRRVNAITRTCEGIIAGRFSERIPLRGRGDEWDRLASAINEMLNRISALLDNLRQVSSDVAHDLRTPLSRLRNRLDDARLEAVTVADYSAAVARAIEDTDQLLSMFSALLRISQVEAGTRMAAFVPLSLTGLLESLYEMYRPVAEDHRQTLESNIQQGVQIRGDGELLTQMFSNLIENAIRHTPAQTSIRVALRASKESIVASISDNGPGIPLQEHEKVLRRFYRLSGGRSAPGHGLGLALVAAIAQLHQATLVLQDAEPGLCVCAKF
jgi:signal transduction histidine kinase